MFVPSGATLLAQSGEMFARLTYRALSSQRIPWAEEDRYSG